MIIALDVGNKRVGIAKEVNGIAFPYKIIERVKIVEELKKLSLNEGVSTIVVGTPLMNGELSEQSKKIERFCDKLKQYFPLIAIKKIDESYTTNIARIYSAQENVDDIAAQIILESYLTNNK